VKPHPRRAGRIALLRAVVLTLLLSGCTPSAPSPNGSSSVTIPTSAMPGTSGTSGTSSPSAPPIDTGNWIVYESKRYGFSIKHPPGWRVYPATHDWTLKADADNWQSAGTEKFVSAANDVTASVWSTPAKDTPATLEGVAAWVEKYCELSAKFSCPGVLDRAVPLCNESDCHSGLLETFTDESQAFFTGGDHEGQLVVIAVWRPELDDTVKKYGGARRLLEGFLSGMDVCPARPDQTPPGCP